ncbi:MAG: ribonuclease HII [Sarcina sp.]
MDILMNSLSENIKNYSYKILNDSIKLLEISNENIESFLEIAHILKSDTRKNVMALGSRLEKNINAYLAEIERVKAMYEFDRALCDNGVLAGVDEVGRGPLAGPIVAAAVVLDLNDIDDIILEINDSKLLSEVKRERLALIIKEKAVSYSIAEKTNHQIDTEGLSYCNNQIFIDSCKGLSVEPHIVLSDGYLIKNYDGLNKFVIKGDSKSASIACASIIAKVYRDNLMKEYDSKYTGYDFSNNVGYGTKKHLEGLKEHGPSEIHRKSFIKNLI